MTVKDVNRIPENFRDVYPGNMEGAGLMTYTATATRGRSRALVVWIFDNSVIMNQDFTKEQDTLTQSLEESGIEPVTFWLQDTNQEVQFFWTIYIVTPCFLALPPVPCRYLTLIHAHINKLQPWGVLNKTCGCWNSTQLSFKCICNSMLICYPKPPAMSPCFWLWVVFVHW